jgi:hypothetical protein
MSRPLLSVVINDAVKLEYDRSARLPGRQRDFVDKMDADMDEGIELEERTIAHPDVLQRGHYVAMTLLQGMEADNEALVGACCAWLASRLPGLREIRAEADSEAFSMQLFFD